MQRSTNTMVEYNPGTNVEYTPGQMVAGATVAVATVMAAMVAASAPVVTVATIAGAATAAVVHRVPDSTGPTPRPPDGTDDSRAGADPVAAD